MQLERSRFRAMGSPCELHLYAPDEMHAAKVAAEAVAEVERLEQKYSRYRGDSLASAINASAGDGAGIEVDEETAGLLDFAETAWAQSGGCFDITSGILRRAWDFKSGRLPEREQVEALLPLIGWDKLRWQRPRLALPLAGMELDFGGYVKEYAADRVAELCRKLGLCHGLVDLGGDLAVIGPHPDGSPWLVGIADPRQRGAALARVPVHYGGVASSGDYERCIVVDGKRYGHILDPRTGWPVEDGLTCVSVIAPQCLVAGSASTITMLKGARAGARWLDDLGLPNLRMDRSGEIDGSLRSRRVPDAEAVAPGVL